MREGFLLNSLLREETNYENLSKSCTVEIFQLLAGVKAGGFELIVDVLSPLAGNTTQSLGDSSPKRCSVELSLLDEPLDSSSGDSLEQCWPLLDPCYIIDSLVCFSRQEVLGPLGADVFIGLSEEEQEKRHIANVEALSDKDVIIPIQINKTF